MRVGTGLKPANKTKDAILYDLLFKKTETQDWIVPQDTKVEPPSWFKEGVNFVAWTENRGSFLKPDYEWIWVEEASEYYRSIQSPTHRKLKHNQKVEQLGRLKSTFDSLFELAMNHVDD